MIRNRSLAMFILLSLLTCGIYGIYFWYCFTEDVNRMCKGDGEESPNYFVVMLLSFVTLGIYHIYWYYKQANRLRNIAPRYGVAIYEGGEIFLLWFLLGVCFCTIISLFSFQVLIKNANAVAYGFNQQVYSNPTQGIDPGNFYNNNTAAVQTYANVPDSKKRSRHKKAAMLTFFIGAIILLDCAFKFIIHYSQWEYSVIIYILPAISMFVLGIFYYRNTESSKDYGRIPLIVFLGLLALDCSRIPYAAQFGAPLEEAWRYESLFGNIVDVGLLLLAVVGCIVLCVEMADIKCNKILFILGIGMVCVSVLKVIDSLPQLLYNLPYNGMFGVLNLFTVAELMVKAMPLLLYAFYTSKREEKH